MHTLVGVARRNWFRGVALVAVFALVFGIIPFVRNANAGTIIVMRDYLNRQQAGLTTGVQHEFFFTPIGSGNGTDDQLTILFPDGDDTDWCRTAGSLTVTSIAEPTGTLVTGESATSSQTHSGSTCAQGSGAGAADSNSDRLIVSSLSTLTGGTKYGFRIVGNTAALGTDTTAANNIQIRVKFYSDAGSTLVDSGTFALSLVSDDQIGVSATVDPTLSVTITGDPVALGTLTTANVSYDGITNAVVTNAASGYVSVVKYDNTLTSGANTINDTAGGTIAANTEEYGVSSSDTDVSAIIATTNTSPACDTTTQTQAGAANATALTTAFKQFAGSTTAGSETVTLCFLAAVDATTAAGSYTSTATLVTTARF